MKPFGPSVAATVLIDVGSSTANVLVCKTTGVQQVRVMNDGTATAWINFGTDSTVTAAATSGIPIATKATEIFTVPDGPVYVAAIAAAATGKIYFTPGRTG